MAKFCTECGAQIKDTAKFCPSCGTTVVQIEQTEQIEQTAQPQLQVQQEIPAIPQQQPPLQNPQPQPIQQQYQQPYQPQYQQPPQQQYPFAPVQTKKKGKGLKIFIIIFILLVVLGGGGFFAFMAINGNIPFLGGSTVNADADFFKIGKDEVPSVKYILGETRNIASVNSSVSGGVTEKVIVYKTESNQNNEMYEYASALTNYHGYYALNDNDFTGSNGTGFQFAAHSVENGYVVIVRIDYNTSGYTLTIKRGTGTLTFDE